jgi:hypothetical protein
MTKKDDATDLRQLNEWVSRCGSGHFYTKCSFICILLHRSWICFSVFVKKKSLSSSRDNQCSILVKFQTRLKHLYYDIIFYTSKLFIIPNWSGLLNFWWHQNRVILWWVKNLRFQHLTIVVVSAERKHHVTWTPFFVAFAEHIQYNNRHIQY